MAKPPSAFEKEHAARVAAVFAKHDTDRSGELARAELQGALTELGAAPGSAAQLDALLRRVDVDASGALSLAEFGSLFSFARLRTAFNQFDADGSGEIGEKRERDRHARPCPAASHVHALTPRHRCA